MYHAAHFQSTEKFQSFTSFLIETKRSMYNFSSLKQSARQFSIQNYLPICSNTTLLKTTIVATLWNNLSCKVKVMAQFLYILYITVNVVTCAEQKSMYSHVSTLTFDQHQFHKFFCLVKLLICKSQCSHM